MRRAPGMPIVAEEEGGDCQAIAVSSLSQAWILSCQNVGASVLGLLIYRATHFPDP